MKKEGDKEIEWKRKGKKGDFLYIEKGVQIKSKATNRQK